MTGPAEWDAAEWGPAPHDRYTRICDAMAATAETHPERVRGDRCIVLLADGDGAGVAISGYDDDLAAAAAMLELLKQILAPAGYTVQILPTTGGGGPL